MADLPLPKPVPVVLVVDDESDAREVAKNFLVELGYRVVQAGSATEAVLILDSGRHVDIVFSDVQIPGPMDGVGLTRWLRTERPAVPVILAARLVDADDVDRQCAPEAFFGKPYQIDRVAEKIRELLSVED